MDLSKGIPRGRISRATPKPFSRPSASISSRALRRAWAWVAAGTLQPGDLVSGHGLVHQRLDDAPTFVAGEQKTWTPSSEEIVLAFVLERDD